MRKLFANCAVLLLGFTSYSFYGQCTPDESVPGIGVYPLIMPSPCINHAYNEYLTLAFPSDTTVSTPIGDVNLAISTLTINSVSGLPDGLSYTCNDNCVFTPNNSTGLSYSCFEFTGTPTESGVFDVTVSVTIAATGISQPYDWGTQVVVNAVGDGDCTDNPTTGIIVTDNTYGVVPNPSNGVFNLERVEKSVILSDSYGTVLSTFENIDRVDLTDFADGVYYLKIDNRMVRVIKN